MTDLKTRIIEAASELLVQGGAAAVSTRAVSTAAGVHAPAIYRLFGDKDDLMSAVASHTLRTYLAAKTAMEPSGDPIEDLRQGWRLHIGFGVDNPDVYTVVYGTRRSGPASTMEIEADAALRRLINGIAEAGLLSVPEKRAMQLVHAAGRGTIFTLIRTSDTPDAADFIDDGFEMVIAAITAPHADNTNRRADPPRQAAITLAASLVTLDNFTDGEKHLLTEWLDRIQEARPAD